MNPIFPFAVLTLTGISAYLITSERTLRFVVLTSTTFAAALTVYTAVLAMYSPISFGSNLFWYIDAPAALLLILVSVISVLAAVVSYRYIGVEYQRGILSLADVRLYYLLFPFFIVSMLAAVMANSLIVLWIAMEGTTLATAFLVGIYRRKSSLEAAWKYVLLCSMGIGLSLTGIVLLMFSFDAVDIPQNEIFLWTTLTQAANNPVVNTALLKLAFVFVMVGFSTKIGLVPLHAWLPDALSKTPSPISAMIAAALLPVSFFSLLRIKHVVDAVLNATDWTESFFLVFGILSVLLSALVLNLQKNYKRMLAFAAIGHMGLLSFAIGAGPGGVVLVLMHLPGYALLLSASYFLAGNIILQARSTDIETVKGLQRRMPITAILFLLVLLLLVGAPPSIFFTTELFLTGYGLQERPFYTLLALLGVTLIAIAVMRVAFTMFFDDEDIPTSQEKHWSITHAVVLLNIIFVTLLGLFILTPEALTFFIAVATPLFPAL